MKPQISSYLLSIGKETPEMVRQSGESPTLKTLRTMRPILPLGGGARIRGGKTISQKAPK